MSCTKNNINLSFIVNVLLVLTVTHIFTHIHCKCKTFSFHMYFKFFSLFPIVVVARKIRKRKEHHLLHHAQEQHHHVISNTYIVFNNICAQLVKRKTFYFFSKIISLRKLKLTLTLTYLHMYINGIILFICVGTCCVFVNIENLINTFLQGYFALIMGFRLAKLKNKNRKIKIGNPRNKHIYTHRV